MLSVVLFKWKKPGYRSTFTHEHVNTMRSMVERCYPDPHRVICITDDSTGIDSRVMRVPLWNNHSNLVNPTWPDKGPSCYRRLRTFSKEFAKIAGERFVCIDLDVVLTRDMRPLWNRPEDFVIYASARANHHYNGSMFLMTAGSRAQVWDDFDPIESPRLAKAAGNNGSDQAWIQYRLGKKEATWSVKDGVYAFRTDLRGRERVLPSDARMVVMHGKPDPWEEEAQQKAPWIRQHYR
jgi:hypothetical protein